MEQKKTLWIIAAVGVFLLVVLGGAMFIYGPTKKASGTTVTAKLPVEKQVNNGWNQLPPSPNYNPNAMPYQNNGFNAQDVSEMVVLSENTKVYGFNTEDVDRTSSQLQPPAGNANQPLTQTIDLNALKKEYLGELQTPSNQNQNVNITVNIPDSYGKAADSYVTVQAPVSVSSEYYNQEVESKAKYTTKNTYEPAPAEKVPAPKYTEPEVNAPVKTPAPSVKTTTVTSAGSKTTTVTTSAAKPVTRFWVQVAAYSNKNTAENARSTLSEKKISSDIYTYQDAKDKLYYRVRVGPFTTKSEAEYWKAKIVEIKDFTNAGSYVTSTTD